MKKTYWKEIWRSLLHSKGRFLSIVLLMLLGSFALVGLKVTGTDMQTTASRYLKQQQVMDLSIVASHGFSSEDQEELASLKGLDLEYGYMVDETIKGTHDALRVFSKTERLSKFQLTSGRWAQKDDEINLASSYQNKYKLGDKIDLSTSQQSLLKGRTFKIVGFVNSSEIWSKTSLGPSSAGDGSLRAYALVAKSAFKTGPFNLARLRYDNLKDLNPFKAAYAKRLSKKQDSLDKMLADNGQRRLSQLQAEAQVKIAAEQEKLNSAQQVLQEQEAGLSSLQGSTPALQVAQQALGASEAKLAEGEAKLQQAKTALSLLKEADYTSYTRSSLPGGDGYQTYGSSTDSIGKIGNLFPVVLYLVAALVTFTTMTRFVDEERTTAGTMKALGYSNKAIILKFVLYGLLASVLGTLIGVLAGHYLLSRIIADIITDGLTIGQTHYSFYWSYTLLALVLALISAVLPAYLISRKELSEKAAQLLLPKPPVKGARVWLENLSFIWQRLSFTHKVTVRNIFRYKERMLMTIFGVAGSVALLFAGLGIQSSLEKVLDNQFATLMPYELMVRTDEPEARGLKKLLKSDDVAYYQAIRTDSLWEKVPGLANKQAVTIMASPKNDLEPLVKLKDAATGKRLTLSGNGVILSAKLAKLYHVKVGDQLSMKDKNGHKRSMKVVAIAEMNVGHYLFMSASTYEQVFGQRAHPNAYLLRLKKPSSQQVSRLAAAFLALPEVGTVLQNTSLIRTVHAVVRSLNRAMTMLIIVSVLLVVVILYNLTNINVAERIRELSTIKVLGFYDKEVTLYIYRETISLSLVGILLGLIAGKGLHRVIMSLIGSDTIQFGLSVSWEIYALPVASTLLILLGLGLLVNHRLKTVDMLEALKSVD